MTEKVTKIEKEKVKEEVKEEEKKTGETPPEQAATPPPTVQQIIEAYPHDREKARDLLLFSIVVELGKISKIMDWFAKRKQEDIDKNITLKP